MRRPRKRLRVSPLGGLVVAGAVTPLPRRGGAPHTWARITHAGAREGIVAHLTAEMHIMLAHLIVGGIALTCAGVLLYCFFLSRGRVYRGGPAPRTADVRVRPGQSYRQALQKEMNRR